MKDIYFEKDYGKLYEEIEGGTCEVFEFESPFGSIRHLFIKKQIPAALSGGPYYDLVTPYGYGGPIITAYDNKNKEKLIKEFENAFRQYCLSNGIVTEFIRFHPILKNAEDFIDCYRVVFKRFTTGTSLKAFQDPVQSEFSKSTKRNIRKALKDGVTFKITENPEDLRNFKDIYHSTMRRNNAESIYYFSDDYFADCLKSFKKNLIMTEVLYKEKVIGMGMNFAYKDTIHTHLSGTLEEYHHLSPAYVLQYAIATWGKEKGFDVIHDGGGRTGELDDPLYLFKKQFGKQTEFKYFVGYKIWNQQIYNDLCSHFNVDPSTNVIPAY